MFFAHFLDQLLPMYLIFCIQFSKYRASITNLTNSVHEMRVNLRCGQSGDIDNQSCNQTEEIVNDEFSPTKRQQRGKTGNWGNISQGGTVTTPNAAFGRTLYGQDNSRDRMLSDD